MAMKELKWKMSSAFNLMSETGEVLDIREEAPSTMKILVERAVTKLLWRNWATAQSAKSDPLERDPEGYWMEELRCWTSRARKGWTLLQAACVNSIAGGGQWPQQRLYDAGVVDDPNCYSCNSAPGTVEHRTWTCSSLDTARAECISEELVAEARTTLMSEPSHPLWTRGLVRRSELPTISPPSRIICIRWYRGEEVGTFTGMVFTDGSMRQRLWWPESARAGWGASQLNNGIATVAFYGTLPGPLQTVPRSEMMAIIQTLRRTILPVRIHTDHWPIVKGLR
jgi:hypothetical protein